MLYKYKKKTIYYILVLIVIMLYISYKSGVLKHHESTQNGDSRTCRIWSPALVRSPRTGPNLPHLLAGKTEKKLEEMVEY